MRFARGAFDEGEFRRHPPRLPLRLARRRRSAVLPVRMKRARSRCFAWIVALAAVPAGSPPKIRRGIESAFAASVEEGARDTAELHPSASATPVQEHGLRAASRRGPTASSAVAATAAVFAAIFAEGFGIPGTGADPASSRPLCSRPGASSGSSLLLVVASLGSAGDLSGSGRWLGRTGGRFGSSTAFRPLRLERPGDLSPARRAFRRVRALRCRWSDSSPARRRCSACSLATFLVWNAIGAVVCRHLGVGSFVLERNVDVLVHASNT